MSYAIVFDVGGVIVDCNPRYLYDRRIADREELRFFLDHVCSDEWNRRQDGGRDLALAVAERAKEFPGFRPEIEIFYTRFDEMIAGAISGMPELIEELLSRAVPLYGLTNWPHATFPRAIERCPVLGRFSDTLVSSTVGLTKPDPAIFALALERFGLEAERTIYVDDHPPNVEAARRLGLIGKIFVGSEDLRQFLATRIDLS